MHLSVYTRRIDWGNVVGEVAVVQRFLHGFPSRGEVDRAYLPVIGSFSDTPGGLHPNMGPIAYSAAYGRCVGLTVAQLGNYFGWWHGVARVEFSVYDDCALRFSFPGTESQYVELMGYLRHNQATVANYELR